jgi:hypothetical protein
LGRRPAIASSINRRVAGSSAFTAIDVGPAADRLGVVGCNISGRSIAACRRAFARLVFSLARKSLGISDLWFW